MVVHWYACDNCNSTFSKVEHVSNGNTVKCTKCKSENIRYIPMKYIKRLIVEAGK